MEHSKEPFPPALVVPKAHLVVAHVVATLDVGGIERWLLELARYNQTLNDECHHSFHIVSLLREDGSLVAPFNQAGANTHYIRFSWRTPVTTFRRLYLTIKQLECDVVHCHVDYLAGIVLPAAWLANCKRRITHLHTTQYQFGQGKGMIKHAAGIFLRTSCLMFSTAIVGCSRAALQAFGLRPSHPKASVLHCSVPMENIRRATCRNRQDIRDGLGWSQKSKIVLHVGRHAAAKNLKFALEVFQVAGDWSEDLRLVLVGSGELTDDLQAKSAKMGLSDRVEFLGQRSDVYEIMLAADMLLFPSVYEGLPITVVEAQACGLPVLMSDAVTQEVCVAKDLVYSMSLTAGNESWARKIVSLLNKTARDRRKSFSAVETTDFNIATTLPILDGLYRSQRNDSQG
jgi:glycosyltransferase involved in cell wall biosynthesis